MGRVALRRAAWLALVLLPAAVPAAAQRLAGAEPFAYVGYSRAWLDGEGGAGDSRTVGGTLGGIGLRAPLVRFVAARVDLVLSRKGGRFAATGATLPEEVAVDLEFVYFAIPIQLHLQDLREGTGFRPFAYVGVEPAFQLGCDVEVSAPGVGVARGACDDPDVLGDSAGFISPDVGLVAGIGTEWRLSSALVQAQLRYATGLRNLRDDLALRHRSIALLLGVGI